MDMRYINPASSGRPREHELLAIGQSRRRMGLASKGANVDRSPVPACSHRILDKMQSQPARFASTPAAKHNALSRISSVTTAAILLYHCKNLQNIARPPRRKLN
jgi:hypothetical protein